MTDDEKKTVDEDFSAELYILEDMGVHADKLKHVKNRAAAQKIIDYMKAKAAKEEPEKPDPKKINKKMLNVGGNDDVPLPDPEPSNLGVFKINMTDLLRPKRAIHFLNANKSNSLWSPGSRIMRVYTDEYPEGQVI